MWEVLILPYIYFPIIYPFKDVIGVDNTKNKCIATEHAVKSNTNNTYSC